MIKNQSDFSLGLVDRNFSFGDTDITKTSCSELKGAKVARTGHLERYYRNVRNLRISSVTEVLSATNTTSGDVNVLFGSRYLQVVGIDDNEYPVYFQRKNSDNKIAGIVFIEENSDGTLQARNFHFSPSFHIGKDLDELKLVKLDSEENAYLALNKDISPVIFKLESREWEAEAYLSSNSDDDDSIYSNVKNLLKQPFIDFENSDVYEDVISSTPTKQNVNSLTLSNKKKLYFRLKRDGSGSAKFTKFDDSDHYYFDAIIEIYGLAENSVFKLGAKKQGNYNSSVDHYLNEPTSDVEDDISIADLSDSNISLGNNISASDEPLNAFYFEGDGPSTHNLEDEKKEHGLIGTVTTDSDYEKYSSDQRSLIGKKLCWVSLDNNRVFICHTNNITKPNSELKCRIYVNYATDLYISDNAKKVPDRLSKTIRFFIRPFLGSKTVNLSGSIADVTDGESYKNHIYLDSSGTDEEAFEKLKKSISENPFDIIGRFIPTSIVRCSVWNESKYPINYLQYQDRGIFFTEGGHISFSKLGNPFVFHDPVVEIHKYRGYEQDNNGFYIFKPWLAVANRVDIETGNSVTPYFENSQITFDPNLFLSTEKSGKVKFTIDGEGAITTVTSAKNAKLEIAIKEWKVFDDGSMKMVVNLQYWQNNYSKKYEEEMEFGPFYTGSASLYRIKGTNVRGEIKGTPWQKGSVQGQPPYDFKSVLQPLGRKRLATETVGGIEKAKRSSKGTLLYQDLPSSVEGLSTNRLINDFARTLNDDDYKGFFRQLNNTRHGKLVFKFLQDFVCEIEGNLEDVSIYQGARGVASVPDTLSLGPENFGYVLMNYFKPPATVVSPFSEQMRLQDGEEVRDAFENEQTLRILTNRKIYDLTDVGRGTTKVKSFVQPGSEFIRTEWSGANYIVSEDRKNIYKLQFSDERQSFLQNAVNLMPGSLTGEVVQVQVEDSSDPALLVLMSKGKKIENQPVGTLYRVTLHESGGYGWAQIGDDISTFYEEKGKIHLSKQLVNGVYEDETLDDKFVMQTHIIPEPDKRGGLNSVTEAHIYGEFTDLQVKVRELYEDTDLGERDARKLDQYLQLKRNKGYVKVQFSRGGMYYRNPVLEITSKDEDCRIFSYSVVYQAEGTVRGMERR